MKSFILRRRAALILLAVVCGLLWFLSACGSSSKPTVNTSPFAQVIFTGDSLTAGYQNGSLWQQQQPNGYAALIAKQTKCYFIMPLVADPGLPSAYELVSIGPPPIIQPMPGTSTGRVNQLMQPTDLAVPGHYLADLLNHAPVVPPQTAEDGITDVVLAYPPGNSGSQIQQAIAAKPTTLFVWIGNNDALVADFAGTPAAMTPISDFTTQFTQLMTQLHSNTTAHIFVANIPDVTLVPYLTPASLLLAEGSAATGGNLSVAQLGFLFGISAGDLVSADGQTAFWTELQAFATAGTPIVALTDAEVLTPAEIAQVQANVAAYNAVIAAQAQSAGATLVDMNAAFNSMKAGIPINGVTATPAYLGGLFSLDGIHPTNTGYALIANVFIDTMNASLGTSVADVDVSSVAASDPLFPPNIKPVGGSTAKARIPAGLARQVKQLFIRNH